MRSLSRRLERVFRPPLLVDRDRHHKEDGDEEDQRYRPVTEREVKRGADDQQEEHGLAHHLSRDRPNGACAPARKLVGAVPRKLDRHFLPPRFAFSTGSRNRLARSSQSKNRRRNPYSMAG